MYNPGQIIQGTLKDDPETKVNFLVIKMRPLGFKLINIPSCIDYQHYDSYFETSDELDNCIEQEINVTQVIQIPMKKVDGFVMGC